MDKSVMPLLLKALISALLVTAIAEISKRSTWIGAITASLPITSLLAMTWLYRDTGDAQKVAELSRGIFWAVLPSLALFILFPILIARGFRFGSSLALACAASALGYLALIAILSRKGLG
jgi:hypothetical protein